jgi:CubicO group peptidase (beta-lactamase class C family)
VKLSFAILLFFGSLSFAGPMQSITSVTELDDYLNEAHFNGVLLVSKDESILFKKAFGVKDFVSNNALTTNDRFQIGSVTKQFVAVAILKLQEENKLSLDDDVTKYLPEYSVYKGIKIRDVLNHTSGIANYTDQKGFFQSLDPNKSPTLSDLITAFSIYPSDFAPTTNWKYSNSGYIIAGRIVEVVSGTSWDNYIKENFLLPLGMADTGYAENFAEVSDVIGHMDRGQGPVPFQMNLSWAASAGGIYSTVDDLAKWTAIYDTSVLLSDSSKTQMQTPFMNGYALGVSVVAANGDTKITHGGRTPGFTTKLTYLKKSKLRVVKFDNTDGGIVDPETIALNLFHKGKADAIKVKPYPVDATRLTEYTGFFKGDGMNFNVFLKENELYLQPDDGQPPYKLVANDKDSFRLLGFAAEEFLRDESGQVVAVRHYQGGTTVDFKKQSPAVPEFLLKATSSSRSLLE